MGEYRMARRVLIMEVSGGRVQGTLRFGWIDVVKVALGSRGMTVENVRKIGRSGEPWGICSCLSTMRPFLLGSCVLSVRPPAIMVAYHLERVGCRYLMRLG